MPDLNVGTKFATLQSVGIFPRNKVKLKKFISGMSLNLFDCLFTQMLTENIMHDCVVKLLKSNDEEAFECLCKLLVTIGKDLDHSRAKVCSYITCCIRPGMPGVARYSKPLDTSFQNSFLSHPRVIASQF